MARDTGRAQHLAREGERHHFLAGDLDCRVHPAFGGKRVGVPLGIILQGNARFVLKKSDIALNRADITFAVFGQFRASQRLPVSSRPHPVEDAEQSREADERLRGMTWQMVAWHGNQYAKGYGYSFGVNPFFCVYVALIAGNPKAGSL